MRDNGDTYKLQCLLGVVREVWRVFMLMLEGTMVRGLGLVQVRAVIGDLEGIFLGRLGLGRGLVVGLVLTLGLEGGCLFFLGTDSIEHVAVVVAH